ncbi:MAG: N-acetylmuramoyl-L-alanine amidase [Chloroflexia bacterium]
MTNQPYKPPLIIDIRKQLPTANLVLRRFRKMAAITRIVVHIDDVRAHMAYEPVQRYIEQAHYHIKGRNWNDDPKGPWIPGFGIMHHYKISAPGRIYLTQPEGLKTWHSASWNPESLAICCDAAAHEEPTQAQLTALHALLMHLCYHRPDIPAGRADVYGHTEEPSTTKPCPAHFLPYVQQFRKGEW